MKWLYKILRVFRCPHKWNQIDKINWKIKDYDDIIINTYTLYILQCCRCGNLKSFRT